mmetsp:Transcript_6684/g.11515  ORF Transcript_6684/g.11515 Transcript_6684/m.11515 type:complete len:120 (-) Transcript_6684:147-506(-)
MNMCTKVVLLVATLAVMMPIAGADCTGCIFSNRYEGSCGFFLKKTDCWSGEQCCADSSGDCCEPDPGPIAGIVIGIFFFLLMTTAGSCACFSCCPANEKIHYHVFRRQGREPTIVAAVI